MFLIILNWKFMETFTFGENLNVSEKKSSVLLLSSPGPLGVKLKMADDGKESKEEKCQIELNEKTKMQASSEEKSDSSSTTKETKSKIDVLLKAAGDAPIMKKKKWAVDANKTVAYLIEFIRKYIKCAPSDSLFLYVNQCFVPYPDQPIQNLYECFGADGKLVLYYCKTQAWG